MLVRSGALLLLLGAVVLAPGCKDDEDEEAPSEEPIAEPEGTGGTDPAPTSDTGSTAPPPRPGERPDLQSLSFAEAPGWKARYDTFLQSWTFEKTTGEGPAAKTSRFYVGHMPADAPLAVDHYASQLRHRPKFQDVGYVYTEVTDKIVNADGWVILGLERDATDPKSTPTPSFVAYRDLGAAALRCRGGRFAEPKHLDEARELCRSADL